MLSRERQAMQAAARIYRSGAKSTEKILAVAVTEMLNLGGLYVKFAQLLLLNQTFAKTVPRDMQRQIFDRVKLQPKAGIDTYFKPHELVALSKDIESIAQKPAYAGSFAAVFDARLRNGEEVIIKILRPELYRSLKHDLRLVALVARPLGLFNEELKSALEGTLTSFRETTLRETDYQQELFNNELLADTFAAEPAIVIPAIYSKLSNRTRIVQQKISGVWLSEVLEAGLKADAATAYVKEQTGSDIEKQLYELGTSSLYRTLMGQTVHGDPHPGNVVLMTNNRVGLIDFGIVAAPVKNRLALLEYVKEQIKGREGDTDIARLMISILRFHANYLYRAIDSLSAIYQRPILQEIYELLNKELAGFDGQASSADFDQGDYSNALSSNINKNNRFGLIPKLDTPLTQKAFMALWRTDEELGFDHLITKIFKDTVRRIEKNSSLYLQIEEKMSADVALQVIAEWLTNVSEKDPKLFLSLQKLFTPSSQRVKHA